MCISFSLLPFLLALALTAFIRGGAMTSPMLSLPCIKSMPSALPCSSVPTVLVTSSMASTGQTLTHPPQEWHRSGNVRILSFTHTMALYWHISAHSPQHMHVSWSTLGTGIPTGTCSFISGFRKRCPLGSSTSQSRYVIPLPNALATCARQVATVVLPVPPLPLATAMRKGLVSSFAMFLRSRAFLWSPFSISRASLSRFDWTVRAASSRVQGSIIMHAFTGRILFMFGPNSTEATASTSFSTAFTAFAFLGSPWMSVSSSSTFAFSLHPTKVTPSFAILYTPNFCESPKCPLSLKVFPSSVPNATR